MNTNFEVSIRELFKRDGIIKIFGIRRIYGEGSSFSEIFSIFCFRSESDELTFGIATGVSFFGNAVFMRHICICQSDGNTILS